MKKYLFFIIILSASIFAISVSPGTHKVNDPVEGVNFSYSFLFTDSVVGAIEYEVAYRPEFDNDNVIEYEKNWVKSLIFKPYDTDVTWSAESKSVTISGQWPDFNYPGRREIRVIGKTAIVGEGTMGGRAAVAGVISIDVPYDGMYADFDVEIDNVQQGDMSYLEYGITSIGTIPITDSQISYSLYDSNKNLLQSDIISLNSFDFADGSVKGNMSLGVLDSGDYYLNSILRVGENILERNNSFLVSNDNFLVSCPPIQTEKTYYIFETDIQNGYLDNRLVEVSMVIDGISYANGLEQIGGLDNFRYTNTLDLRELVYGNFTYNFVLDGDTACTGSLSVIEYKGSFTLDNKYLYLIVLIILIVSCLVALYYYKTYRVDEDDGLDF